MEHSTSSYANSEIMHQPCSSQLPQTRDCQFLAQAKSYHECYQSKVVETLDVEDTFDNSIGPSQDTNNNSDILSAVRIQEYLLEPMYSWMKPKKGEGNHFGRLRIPTENFLLG